jgi:hypothetical protein
MITRSIFEMRLHDSLQLQVADPSHYRAAQELKEAAGRLEHEPSLFSGDPNGEFTYEHPILANALLSFRDATEIMLGGRTEGADLQNSSIFRWMLTGVHAFLSRIKGHANLPGMTPRRSVKIRKDVLRVGVIGDAGYRGNAQEEVLNMMKTRHMEKPFDLMVHLGDTYFGGSEREVIRNLIDPFKAAFPEVRIIALCGNHDLYYGETGHIYTIHAFEQPGRYLCVETPHWRILCLDTTTGATGILRNDAKLDLGQVEWLDEYLARKGKPIVLMSHHYIVSAWGGGCRSLERQLKHRLKRGVVAWYWGHEHVCAAYKRTHWGFYGACIGNGSFLEVREPPTAPDLLDWAAKKHCCCFGDRGPRFWPHGFLELELSKDVKSDKGVIREEYFLEEGERHSRELEFLEAAC